MNRYIVENHHGDKEEVTASSFSMADGWIYFHGDARNGGGYIAAYRSDLITKVTLQAE